MADKWQYSGDYLMTCNCDYGCPCNFNARPTQGYCEGLLAVRVREGAYGKTSLKGAKAVMAAWWPGAIHEGGGVMQPYLDAGSAARREAMMRILSGEAGGMPWALLAKTYKVLPPRDAKIQLDVKGKDSRIRVGDVIDAQAEAVRNPVTKEETSFDVVIQKPLIAPRMSVFASKKNETREAADPRLSWSHAGRHFGVAKVRHKGP